MFIDLSNWKRAVIVMSMLAGCSGGEGAKAREDGSDQTADDDDNASGDDSPSLSSGAGDEDSGAGDQGAPPPASDGGGDGDTGYGEAGSSSSGTSGGGTTSGGAPNEGDDEGQDDQGTPPRTSDTDGSFEGTGDAGESGGTGDFSGTGTGESGDTDDIGASTGSSDSGSDTGEEPICLAEEPVTLYLSPDDSNSMSSPVQAREAILNNFSSIRSVPIRTWEFLNYYHFAYPAAPDGQLLVTPSMVHDEGMADGEYQLQIGVSSPTLTNDDRPPLNITLVLDTSGSMSGQPIEMLRESVTALAASLRAGDIISMVTWDTSNAVILAGHEVTGPDDPALLDEIAQIEASGGTNLNAGLIAGYDLAQSVYDNNRINRIVLISDGGANAGVTDVELIAQNAGGREEDGVYMVGVGVGSANSYNDELMDGVTDAGKGASVFIASANEAWKIFHEQFVNTLAVAARDVQVRVDLPPGFEIETFSGEEYSADPTEVEPQHIAPNDAMVFHQRIETCAPELITDDTEIVVTARFKDGTTFEARETTVAMTFPELLATDPALLRKGSAIFEYAEALKAFQQTNDRAESLAPARQALALALELLPNDPDLLEIQTVLDAI